MTIHTIPSQPTPFVGREKELTHLMERINNPDCRLLTLTGLGGSGKTRLAIELVNRMPKSPRRNVYFVALQPVTSPHNLPLAIADAMQHIMRGSETPEQQVLHHLQDKDCLLILDNFEHLLEAADFLSEMLRYAPDIKILVTSREVLNLREEWLFPVPGMKVPSGDQTHPTETYDSIELFGEHALRVYPNFSLEADQRHVIRICQLVEGLPLAIELAASWLRYMSCAQIAEEIVQGVDYLQTNMRNLPERHQSLKIVFDQSWMLLTEHEQDACKRLSTFRGHFGRDAAVQVARAHISTLSALVDKSILHRNEEGRYWMHELLRQYAERHLEEDAGEFHAARERLGDYYAKFLQTRMDGSMGKRQIAVVQEIAHELENIRAAWQWAVEENNLGFFEQAGQALHLFYQFTSRYAEGAETLLQAVRGLEGDQSARATRILLTLESNLGWLYIRLGKLSEAERILLRCIAQYHQLDIPPLHGHATDPRLPLGIISVNRGDYHRAQQYGEEARRIAEEQDHIWNMAFADYVLANAFLAVGALDEAERYANEACHLAEQVDDSWSLAYFLNERGNVARALKDYAAANHYFYASYEIRKAFNDPEGMAVALSHLGEVALLQNEIGLARDYYRQSRSTYETLQDRGGLAETLTGLGTVAAALGDYPRAAQLFQNALQIARSINYLKLSFTILTRVAAMWLDTGEVRRAGEVLAVVQHHPGSNFETRALAKQLLQAHAIDVSAPVDLQNALGELLEKVGETLEQSMPQKAIQLQAQQALAEPLTERELEVLDLLAQGKTNEEIAEALTIVIGTVKAHNNRIFGKLGVANRTQASVRARELNLL